MSPNIFWLIVWAANALIGAGIFGLFLYKNDWFLGYEYDDILPVIILSFVFGLGLLVSTIICIVGVFQLINNKIKDRRETIREREEYKKLHSLKAILQRHGEEE